MQSFLDSHSMCPTTNTQNFQVKSQGGNSKGTSRAGSSASSIKSVKSGTSSTLAPQSDYTKAILSNVLQFGGYRHLLRFLKRSGKSKLSIQKIIKMLQKSFSPEDWYYYRKIHKKDKNYFLNKGG